MRFAIEFENDAGECRSITVDLELPDIDYVEKVRANGGRDPGSGIPTDPDVVAMGLALRRAYAALPRGFQHVAPPELLRAH